MPKIICARCKNIEDVEDAPTSSESALCSAFVKATASKNRATKKRKSIPSKQHGTRVMLPITCAECGETDTLDYVPKGADLDDVLCRECALEQFGTDSAWARIEREKEAKRKRGHQEFEFECHQCGRTDYLPFEPQDDRTYDCNLCRLDHDTPSPQRLANREKAAGGVFIRRNTGSDD